MGGWDALIMLRRHDKRRDGQRCDGHAAQPIGKACAFCYADKLGGGHGAEYPIVG